MLALIMILLAGDAQMSERERIQVYEKNPRYWQYKGRGTLDDGVSPAAQVTKPDMCLSTHPAPQ